MVSDVPLDEIAQSICSCHPPIPELKYLKNPILKKINNIRAEDPSLPTDPSCFISGLGADEMLCGYSRHRNIYNNSPLELNFLLKEETDNLWRKNMGRDTRSIMIFNNTICYPYIDGKVKSFIFNLPEQERFNMNLPKGEGEKLLIRKTLENLGFKYCHRLKKRAIQFGSRISKYTSIEEEGSRRKVKGTNKI